MGDDTSDGVDGAHEMITKKYDHQQRRIINNICSLDDWPVHTLHCYCCCCCLYTSNSVENTSCFLEAQQEIL